jgi:oxygen-independent coproporphyrinogen III oxidase
VQTVARGELPVFRGCNCSSVDLVVRDAVMGIKLVHLDHAAFQEKHGVDLVKACGDELAALAAAGFLTVGARTLSLTDHGVIFGDYVARVLEGALKKRLAGDAQASRARVLF